MTCAVPVAVAGVLLGRGRAVATTAVPSTMAAGMVRGCRVSLTCVSSKSLTGLPGGGVMRVKMRPFNGKAIFQ